MKTENLKNPKDEIALTNPTQLGALEFERALCLDKHELSEEGGNNEVLICDNLVKINGVKIDPEKYVSITKEALSKLYKDSTSLRTHPADVLVLKVILAADTNNTMCYFYQPMSLALNTEIIDAELQNQGIFNVGKSGPTYEYIPSEFKEAAVGERANYYQEHVSIFHNKTDKWGAFISGKDVEAVIFSFQEIFNFMHTNNLDTVKIFNCARGFNTIAKGHIIKHSLILAENGPFGAELKASEINSSNLFRGKYSNLTHLCPPNCARLLYALERLDY